MTKQRTLDDMSTSKYMKTSDVVDNNFTATIVRIDLEKMRDGEEKDVAYFKGHQKGIVLNPTKGKILAGLAKSKNVQDWVGLDVFVCDGLTDLRGEEVPCIKFRPPKLAKPTASHQEPLNDPIPGWETEDA
jgi:hypothetical protein